MTGSNSTGRRTAVARLVRAAAAAAGLVAGAGLAQGQLVDQPAGKRSFLYPKKGKGIRDDDFAAMVKDLLVKDGKSVVREAKFFFQSCFGGGMLDDLRDALGETVKWVGGSASRHDQRAFQEPKTKQDPKQNGIWTELLLKELGKKNPNVSKAIGNANKRDKAKGKDGKDLEEGQLISRNGGDKITLADPTVKSHHAVIWAGIADLPSIQRDVVLLKDTLSKAWAGTPHTIDVLLDDGMRIDGDEAATRDRLAKTFEALKPKLNPDEEFLFFAHDHGGLVTEKKVGLAVPGFGVDVEGLDLFPDELAGIFDTPDNVPTLTVDYLGLTAPAAVTFNGTFLGDLDPTRTRTEFVIPEEVLSLSNTIRIENSGPDPFTLDTKTFDTGGIRPGTSPTASPVPGPGGLGLAAAGGLALFAGRRWQRAGG